MPDRTREQGAPRPPRVPIAVTVTGTEWLTPAMVRVVLTGDAVRTLPDIGHTDTYVRLVLSADHTPRAYTLRWVDRAAGELAIDFLVHGDEGIAGPWAAAARPGDVLEFLGPGSDWAPRPGAEAHLFVGDESALPAIASGLEALLAGRPDAVATVFAEVASAGLEYPLPAGPGVAVTWVYRDGAGYGERLVEAVLGAPFPAGDVEAFVHGNAEMVRPLRRYLLRERGLERGKLSISGYWRVGHTDDAWRAVKRDFNAAMEAEAGA